MDFQLLIEKARRAVNSSLQKILELFPENNLFLMSENDTGQEIMVETRVEDATLNCIVHEKELCKLGYVFLDDSSNIHEYISFCNANYPFNESKKSWILSNCFLKVEEEREDMIFILFAE